MSRCSQEENAASQVRAGKGEKGRGQSHQAGRARKTGVGGKPVKRQVSIGGSFYRFITARAENIHP